MFHSNFTFDFYFLNPVVVVVVVVSLVPYNMQTLVKNQLAFVINIDQILLAKEMVTE